jgi:purine-nucleoside phosphorylase
MTSDPVVIAARYLGDRLRDAPSVVLVLGSGLGGLAEAIEDALHIPYTEIPGFPEPTVTGHRGRVVAGRLAGAAVLAFQGRYHAYEGHDLGRVVLPVRVAAALGAGTLVVTCAAGGVNRSYGPGTLMLISDHLNLMGGNPLAGPVRAGEARFPDMSGAYDPALRAQAVAVAREEGIPVAEGVYAGVLGPSYETPAEVRMIERLGGDAVGMSTVPEVIAGRAAGLRILGVALITNQAAGVGAGVLNHDEVLAAAEAAAGGLERLVGGVVAWL